MIILTIQLNNIKTIQKRGKTEEKVPKKAGASEVHIDAETFTHRNPLKPEPSFICKGTIRWGRENPPKMP